MAASNNGGGSNTDGRRFVIFDFKPEGGCIPDTTMQELVRRLTAYVEASGESGYIRSVSPPNDLTATWVPIDGNGNRVGNNRVYDPATGQWTDDFASGIPGVIFVSANEGNKIVFGTDNGIFVAPRKFVVRNETIVTSGTMTIDFPAFGIPVDSIGVNMNFRSDKGADHDLRLYIESITDGQLKIKVLGFDNTIVPNITLRVEIYEL